MKKVLVLDIDNTLIEPFHALGQRSEQALRRWLRAGYELVSASGKSPCAFRQLTSQLQRTHGWHLASNGGVVVNIATQQCEVLAQVGRRSRECLRLLTPFGLPVYLYQSNRIQLSCPIPAPDRQLAFLQSLQDPPVVQGEEIDFASVIKLLLFVGKRQTELQRQLETLPLPSGLHWVRTGEDLLEIHDVHQTKAEGLRFLAEREGWTLADILAVGDSDNDRSMLEIAGHPYLVANASDSLKACGWPVLPSCSQQGVAVLIERLLKAEGMAAESGGKRLT